MPAPADLVLTNAEVHTLTEPDEEYEAVAVRDGRIVRVSSAYEVDFLVGVETEVVDCERQVVLPGFVDAHTHLEMVGQHLVHADLRDVDSPADAVDRLQARADETDDEFVLGYGYDESTWDEARYLTRDDLDSVAEDRPVIAFREDMHTASLNSAALDHFRDDMPADDVEREAGEPTGVVVEAAVDPLFAATEADYAETRDLVLAAQERANELGVTGVHDMCRNSHKPRVYRDLDSESELTLRTRINYWTDHLESVVDAGLRSGHGSAMVRTGAIKTYTDGTFGARTAKLREPYADAPDGEQDGQWVVAPDALREYVETAHDAGLQFTAHAIGDAAVEGVLDVLADSDAGGARHRVEHAELLTEDLVERFAAVGAVASVQPNFLKWARDGGLYDARLGERRREVMPFSDLLDAGVPLAFGSDCMPLDPLFGVQQAVTAPEERQRLSVTEALRAYTHGAAYAAGEEAELGTVDPGKRADLVVLDESPWAVDVDAIADIDVALTVVDGRVVHRN
jgi:hypothetical protein